MPFTPLLPDTPAIHPGTPMRISRVLGVSHHGCGGGGGVSFETSYSDPPKSTGVEMMIVAVTALATRCNFVFTRRCLPASTPKFEKDKLSICISYLLALICAQSCGAWCYASIGLWGNKNSVNKWAAKKIGLLIKGGRLLNSLKRLLAVSGKRIEHRRLSNAARDSAPRGFRFGCWCN